MLRKTWAGAQESSLSGYKKMTLIITFQLEFNSHDLGSLDNIDALRGDQPEAA